MARSYANVSHFEWFDGDKGIFNRCKYGPKSKGLDYNQRVSAGYVMRVVYKTKLGFDGPSWRIVANADNRPAGMAMGHKATKTVTKKAA